MSMQTGQKSPKSPRPPIVLSYQRLLSILNNLTEEEGKYILFFLQSNEQKCRRKARELDRARVEFEQSMTHTPAQVEELSRKIDNLKDDNAKMIKKIAGQRNALAMTGKLKGTIAGLEGLILRVIREGVITDDQVKGKLLDLTDDLARLIATREEMLTACSPPGPQ